MKIVCQSCSAKYSIADDKIAGKVFKIRCKKCGSNIEVHGDTASTEVATGRPSFDYGGEAIWHVMVDGEQQGPFAPEQIGAMITAEKIGWDAYVWREGLDDWKAASDVEELAQAIMGTGGAPAKSPPAKGSASAADLFAKGDDDDDVVASAPSAPRAASPAATGARNESSVLFSLSNLQSMAAAGPSGGATSSSSSKGAAAPAGKGAGATGDASGLVDIRALASATGLLGGGAGASGAGTGSAKAAKVDDLLSIGAPSGGLGSPLGAPVIIAQKEEPTRGGGSGGMIAAAAIVAIAVLGGAGIFAYASLNQPAPTTAAAPPPTEAPPAPPTTAIAAPPTTVAIPASSVEPPPSTAVAHHPHATGTAPHATTAGDTPVTPPPATHTSGTESLDDLIAHATHPTHTSTATPPASAAGPSLPTTPSASDVRAAMAAVQPAVTACGAGAHGVATVQVVIAGATGRVSNATVSGDFAGTPVGSCVARAVRTATFPHFSQASFSVGYPFRI